MMKRSLFLSLAASFLASLALVTPSRADSTLVTANVKLNGFEPTETLLEIKVAFPDAFEAGSVTQTSSAALGSTVASGSSAVIFTPTSTGISIYRLLDQVFVDFTTVYTGSVAAVEAELQGKTTSTFYTSLGTVTNKTALSFSTYVAVPEPQSMAMLGIGITGLFAFRRLFNKRTVKV